MPFKTSCDPTELWSNNRWFISIMATCIVLLLGGILGYAIHELGAQEQRIGNLEKQNGITDERIAGIRELINERTNLLEAKLDSLRELIELREN